MRVERGVMPPSLGVISFLVFSTEPDPRDDGQGCEDREAPEKAHCGTGGIDRGILPEKFREQERDDESAPRPQDGDLAPVPASDAHARAQSPAQPLSSALTGPASTWSFT